MLSLLYSLAVYLRVRQRIVSLRRNASMAGTPAEGGSSTLNELMHRFVSFLAVYGAINGFRIVRRFADAVAPDQPVYALWMLHSFFGPIQVRGR